jgi:hypothetical protein
MPTYRVITQLFYGKDQLSFNNCYIEAISPSQAMRKHKIPKLKPNQQIIINILPTDKYANPVTDYRFSLQSRRT